MGIDPRFMQEIQRAGWQIVAADGNAVIGGCPRGGCSVKVKLSPGAPVPDACNSEPSLPDQPVDNFETARVFLRDRRQRLGLTIRETEEIAGITVDFLAKFEKDDPSKIPNTMTFIEWAQALGYEVVLRPSKLPAVALRVIAENRDRLMARRKRLLRPKG